MTDNERAIGAEWTDKWLSAVADGSATMSQRGLSSLEKRGGGLEAVRAAATAREIHLLLLEDDEGRKVVAASLKPFQVIC